MNILPVGKTSEIVVQELKGELLIYDLATNKAFCLNQTAAIIYRACDGQTSFAELKRKYEFSDDLIYLALDTLEKENLLVGENNYSPFAGIGRREVIKRVGLASMIALPMIFTMVAPAAAQAASGGSCTPNAPNCTATGQNVNSIQPSNDACRSSNGTGGASTCCNCAAGGSTYDSGTKICELTCG